MSVSPGDRIGPYEVVAPLGAGGMGQVFRARDTRLKRDVALKVLPPAAIGDAERRTRFDREAQVLASLNHPNIAQVFGVEESDGAPVIVMELVEGETLARRLESGGSGLGKNKPQASSLQPLSSDEALRIALQLCDGLEAAHERAVIHRDLKPANIALRADGTIKILDFGLARVLTDDSGQGGADSANRPTMLGADTQKGVVLGTVAYMSPEQARGRPVDKRTDIWAFGCVLMEMLTGAPAFAGESTTDVLASIVQGEPDWSALPAGAPPRIAELLRRCLQKNLKDRLRDIADARYEIARASQPPVTSHQSPVPATSHQPPVTRHAAWLALAFAAGATIAAATLLLTPALRTTPVTSQTPLRAVIQLPPDTTIALSRGAAVALSPDGRQLVFAGRAHGKTELYLRALDRFESQVISGTEDAANPFFSPDGRWLGFFAGDKLKKVSLDGGAPVVVADVTTPRGEVWSGNDTILVTPSNNAGISRVSTLGGKLEAVTSLHPGELSHRWPHLLPDGSAVLFTLWNDNGWEPARIAAQRLSGGDRKIVVEGGGGYGRYIRDASGGRGYLIYARSEGLLAATFDESRLALASQPIPIVDGVVTNLSGGAHFDVSASGTLAYVPGTLGEAERDLVWVTLDGKVEPALKVRGMSRVFSLSPDGTRVVRNNTIGPNRDVWIEDLVRHTTTRVTNLSDSFNTNAIWSPDGKWVAFARGAPTTNLYRRAVDGRDIEQQLTGDKRSQYPTSFSPDGTALAYTEFDPVSGGNIWVLTIPPGSTGVTGAGAKPSSRAFVQSNAIETYPAFSPDGRWISYQSNESGRFEIYVRSFPDGARTNRVSTAGGINATWLPNGHAIIYRRITDLKVMRADIETSPEFRIVSARELFDGAGYENISAISPDGKRLLMMPLIPAEQSATQVNLVVNFLAELRQRVR